jgi:beta-glucuronidase
MLAASSVVLVVAASEAAVRVGADTAAGTTSRTAGQSVPAAEASSQPPSSVPLNQGWSYIADPGNIGLRHHWGTGGAPKRGWSRLTIPDDYNAIVSNTSDSGRVGWYQVRFTGPPVSSGRAWNIHFEEVRRNTTVWLNGMRVGSNSSPYTPFNLRASTLVPGGSNVLIVRVDNIKGPAAFPEDWWNWGGIVRPVTLEPVGRIVLRDLGVMPRLGCAYRCGELLVHGTLLNRSPTSLRPEIVVRVTSPAGGRLTARHQVSLIRSGGTVAFSFPMHLHGPPDLWSPANPSLYGVRVSTDAGGRVEQLNSLRVGMRDIHVHAGILYLNGQRLWLHGAAIHEDVSGRGAALTDGDINTIVSELRSVGANITRSHYLLSERMLDALDSAGILVWSQPPVDHADARLRTTGGRARAIGMLRATILAERSHPSVIVDSVGNELTPTPDTNAGTGAYLRQAIPIVRQLDPAALVGLDIYCYPAYPRQHIYSRLDVLGISDYFGWYGGPTGHSIADFNGLLPFLEQARANYPHQALAISEFGAEGLYDGPITTKGSYEFQSDYLQRTFGVIDRLPFMNGAIYWTLREFAVNPGWTGGAILPPNAQPDGIHHKGLIAYDGTEKPAFAVAQQLFGSPPAFAR